MNYKVYSINLFIIKDIFSKVLNKKIFSALIITFFLSSFNFSLTHSIISSHDDNICSSSSNKLDINCISHCAITVIENLDTTKLALFLDETFNYKNYSKFLKFSLYFDIRPQSNSPPLLLVF